MVRINIRRLAVSLLVGVVVTVLVAWYRPVDMSAASIAGYPDLGITAVGDASWPIDVPSNWPQTATMMPQRWHRMRDTVVFCDFFNHGMRDGSGPIPETMHDVCVVRSGWPCRAMVQYEAEWGLGRSRLTQDLGFIRNGLPVPQYLQSVRLGTTTPLPLMPLWTGFLANTLLCAAIPWLIMTGLAALKRSRRARRGLCIQCAYPNVGLRLCPECGTATPNAAAGRWVFMGASDQPRRHGCDGTRRWAGLQQARVSLDGLL